MRVIRLLLSAFVIILGAALFVYGGYDDSPGAQLLGIVVAGGGILSAIRAWRKDRN